LTFPKGIGIERIRPESSSNTLDTVDLNWLNGGPCKIALGLRGIIVSALIGPSLFP